MSSPRIDLGSEQLGATLWSEVTVEQKLNDHWTCRIVLRDTSDRRPEVEDYSGQPLCVTTFSLDGSENVIFSGFVHHMRLVYEVSGAYGAVLEAVSLSWKLDQGPRHAYFKQQTAHGTASKVLASSGLSVAGAMPAGATLSYVQWEETDFHFFARLVDDCEAWFRPAVDGSAALEAQTAFQPGPTVQWREGEYGLLEWTTRGQLRPIAAEGAHYDYQPMGSAVATGVTAEPAFFGSAAERMVAAVRTGAPQLGSAWADRHRSATLGDHTARLERESRRGLASAVTCVGISREPQVRAGDTVTVAGLPGVDAVYGVLEVAHRWTPKGYENRFTATPASRWSPAERPARPSLDGLYPARVVANHDPHNQGRIRVSYYWQQDGATSWVRLLAPHAGPGRGFLFLPEVGDEVLICFEEGDPERPYAVGSAWNGVHQPPSSGFHVPGSPNGTEFAPNNVKRLVTKSGHRITMVDTPGKETVSIATPQHNRLMLTEQHADTGRPAIVLATAGDLILSAPNGRIHTKSATHSREVGAPAPPALAPPPAPPAASSLSWPDDNDAEISAEMQGDDAAYDGALIGTKCQALTYKKAPGERLSDTEIKNAWSSAYQSDSSCCQARRAAGQAPKHIIYVNGIQNNKADQCVTLQKIANQTCAQVLGVHNTTAGKDLKGLGSDVWQTKGDRDLISQANAGKPISTHDGRNPAVDSLSDVLYNSVLDGDPPEIYAHSQGGAVASLASYDANNRLINDLHPSGISGLQVTSLASAAPSWPSTMSGQHFVNIQDATPVKLGMGSDPGWDAAHTGPNQQVIRFQGAPGATDPIILNSAQLQTMNEVTTNPYDGTAIAMNMPPVSLSAYHDVNTTYLNAARKVNGGCSADGN